MSIIMLQFTAATVFHV